MSRNAGWILVLLVSACAGRSARPAPQAALEPAAGSKGLFVGHDQSGALVIAATHYDAMRGLAVSAEEIGAPVEDGRRQMLCEREMPTGTHVPRWICRYQADIDDVREQTLNDFTAPRLAIERRGATSAPAQQIAVPHGAPHPPSR